jgi:hypothetical protein
MGYVMRTVGITEVDPGCLKFGGGGREHRKHGLVLVDDGVEGAMNTMFLHGYQVCTVTDVAAEESFDGF